MMGGPHGKGGINQDTYDGQMPASLPPAPVKVIIATDPKNGPPSPASKKGGAGINVDCYYE